MKHGEFMTFENEKLNEMRIWLYNADELHIENKILHSFTRSSKKYAIDAFMNDLDMNYSFPLNVYISSIPLGGTRPFLAICGFTPLKSKNWFPENGVHLKFSKVIIKIWLPGHSTILA